MRSLLVFCLFVSTSAMAGKLPLLDSTKNETKAKASKHTTLEELKMKHRFGLGVSAAGPLAMLGIEADVNLTEDVAFSVGIGTGIYYSTFMIKGRYFLMGEWVSPYIGGGFARWWSDGTTRNLGPAVLRNKFLRSDEGGADGFNVWIIYPCAGVQFMSVMGFDVFAEIQYLFRLPSFSNGTYAGLGMHWYF